MVISRKEVSVARRMHPAQAAARECTRFKRPQKIAMVAAPIRMAGTRIEPAVGCQRRKTGAYSHILRAPLYGIFMSGRL